MATMELDARYWISLVRKLTQDLEVTDCLERHGVPALDQVDWIDGTGRVVLPGAGVHLHLRKTHGSPPEVWVHGVEFVLLPKSSGSPYAGSLPQGITASDSPMEAGMKLNPAMLLPAKQPGHFEAVFPEHKLALSFDATQRMRSCAWLTTRADPEPLDWKL